MFFFFFLNNFFLLYKLKRGPFLFLFRALPEYNFVALGHVGQASYKLDIQIFVYAKSYSNMHAPTIDYMWDLQISMHVTKLKRGPQLSGRQRSQVRLC